MASSNRLVVEAFLDAKDFERGANLIVANLERIKQSLSRADQISTGRLADSFKAARAEVSRLATALKELKSAQADLQASGNKRSAAGLLGPTARGHIADSRGRSRQTGNTEQLAAGIKTVDLALKKAREETQLFSEGLVGIAAGSAAFREISAQVQIYRAEIAKANQIATSGTKDAAFGISRTLESEISKIQEQIRQVEGATKTQLDTKSQRALSRQPILLQKAADLRRESLRIDRDILEIEKRIADSQDHDGGLQRQKEDKQKRRQLVGQRADSADLEAKQAGKRATGTRELSGVQQEYDELQKRLARLVELQNQLGDPRKLALGNAELRKAQEEVAILNREIQSENISERRRVELIREATKATKRYERAVDQATKKALQGNQAFGSKRITAAIESEMPGINKLFQNVFNDMSRRFTATLQFAISGAIIFGVQRFVREFFEAAIDVQRAFADIESALEFDIEASRGTAEFNQQVEGVRQDVLKLAREFNILPTEANKAAFVMVSRFNNVENALKATRAQLLATKVSTIDQSEVLRALTAVSETFAAEVFDVNEGMSIQEKLFKREAIAASLYASVLDDAVLIQQRFGIEVEDTLEGTARAAEAFRQMGFTLQQTEAIVASVSRQLGQTGQQSAERLVRSIGQLTDPKIRDSLLELAASSSAFNLGLRDFESGATAWEKIASQFERIERVDPSAATAILQTIGQRRELEAVAAALGTADLQRDMISATASAAGSAEQRFSYLKRTVGELIGSIASGFQELAQNFERLGGISSLQLLLTGLDSIITAANEFLELIVELKNGLDELVGFKLGSMIVGFVSMGLAIGTVLRVAIALKETFAAMAVTNVAQMLSHFWSAAGAGAGVGTFAAAKTAFARGGGGSRVLPGIMGATDAAITVGASRNVLARSGAALAAGSTTAVRSLGKFSRAALGMVPVWGWVAAGVITTGLALKGFYDQARKATEAMVQYEKGQRDADALTRQQIRDQDIERGSPEAISLARENRIAELRSTLAAAPGGPSLMDHFGKFLSGQGLFTFFGDIVSGGDITGKKPMFEEQLRALLIAQGQNIIEDARSALADGPRLQKEITGDQVRQLGEAGLFAGGGVASTLRNLFGGEDPIATVQAGIERQLAEADKLYFDAKFLTGTDADKKIAEADALVAEAEQDYQDHLDILGLLPKHMEESILKLNRELKSLDTDVFLGRKTEDNATQFLKDAANRKRAYAAELRVIGESANRDEIQKLEDEADSHDRLFYERRLEQAKKQQAARTLNQGSLEKLAGEIRALMQTRVGYALAGINTAEVDAEIDRLDVEYANKLREIALQDIESARALARSYKERRRLTDELIRQLRIDYVGAVLSGNTEAIRSIDNSILTEELARDELDLQNAIDENTARIKLAAPALSSRASLEAQIVAVKIRLAREADGGDAAKFGLLTQELRELEAQGLQAELERLTALNLAKVSVNDSLSLQLIQLSSLKQKLILSASLYGETSIEYANVTIAIMQTEAAIREAVLEIESVSRQLSPDFDVTNPLHAAEEAWIKAARALKIPDLAKAEREAAELNLKNAEAARLAAVYNDALFSLKFDFEFGNIGESQYIAELKKMLDSVDLATDAGKKLWIQINGLIEGMTDDLSNQAFNIPGQIRIPTLFEVRRAVQAESYGVNYLDNRQQDINVYVSDEVQLDAVFEAISGAFEVEDARYAPGGAGITIVHVPDFTEPIRTSR